ncbi:hypothetical protein DL95DRAFT_395851 [Leptodontidium sp. 2 PMI_412]|nr:hypothetical protein DL95DRAFT_395851 [Leptodontidium sp. 2 PMI_412]
MRGRSSFSLCFIPRIEAFTITYLTLHCLLHSTFFLFYSSLHCSFALFYVMKRGPWAYGRA